MEVKNIYLQDCKEKKDVQIVYCLTSDIIADSLAKPLWCIRLQKVVKLMILYGN